LMVLMSWQLRLARSECIDSPLPWQSRQDKLSPGRVAQAFASILAGIGTPAKPPKPSGKSPGRATGECPSARPHYPTVKKRVAKAKKAGKVPKRAAATAAYSLVLVQSFDLAQPQQWVERLLDAIFKFPTDARLVRTPVNSYSTISTRQTGGEIACDPRF
jgi:hypothetical protein